MAKQLKREYKMTKHRKQFQQFKTVQGKKSSRNEGIQRIPNNTEQGSREYGFKGHNKMKLNKQKRI